MNQLCKVCGEPAAGFHFGAFTCEGCKSFFGRTYNNLSSLSECKNNGRCVINKKNRTSCKSCRLRKCLMVGMSKSGSRYGRRSNWFKIHCLLQDQANLTASHQIDPTAGCHNGFGGPLQTASTGGKVGYEADERARGDSSSSESGMRGLDDTIPGVPRGATSSPDSHDDDDDDSSKLSSIGGSSLPPSLLWARGFAIGDASGSPLLKNGMGGGGLPSPFSPGLYDSPSPPRPNDKKDPTSAAAAAAAAAAFLLAPPHHLPMSPISPLSPVHQPTKFLFNPGYFHHHHHALQGHPLVNGLNGYSSKMLPAYRPYVPPSALELFTSPNNVVQKTNKGSTAPVQESPIDLSVKKSGRSSTSTGNSLDDEDGEESPLSPGDGTGVEAGGGDDAMEGDTEEAPASPLDLTKERSPCVNDGRTPSPPSIKSAPPSPTVVVHE